MAMDKYAPELLMLYGVDRICSEPLIAAQLADRTVDPVTFCEIPRPTKETMACASSASSGSSHSTVLLPLALKTIAPSRSATSPPWHEMPINVHRHVYGGVPHERLNALRVLAIGDQEARVGVAEIMKPDLAEPRAPERRVETAVQ
jgi:hypothetical protein